MNCGTDTPPSCLASLQPAFMRFAERHRRLVNALVHHKPQLLQTSLALLLRAPKLLDFDNVSWLGFGQAAHTQTCTTAAG